MLAEDIQNPKNQAFDSDDSNLRFLIATSHRFVLDEEATRLCVDTASIAPEEILRMLPLARLPYERVWIEVPRGAKLDQQWRHGTMAQPQLSHPESKIGYYLERSPGRVDKWRLSVSEHSIDGPPEYMGWPIGFVVDLQQQMVTLSKDGAPVNAPSQAEVDGMLWGYHPKTSGLSSLTNYAGYTIHPTFAKDLSDLDIDSMMRELSGTVRFVVAMLAILTACPVEYVDVAPRGTHLVNRKPKARLKYQIPKMMLPRRKPKNPGQWARKFIHAAAKRMRRHFVKGHWRTLANTHKVWVHEHERGDARLGHVGYLTEVKGRK